MPVCVDTDYVLTKLAWMREQRIWPNGLRYLWTDAFGVILLASLHRELKEDKALAESQLARADSVIKFMDQQFVLQVKADREKDEVIQSLEVIVKHHKKELRRQKLRSTILNIVLGVGLAAETAIIINAAIR